MNGILDAINLPWRLAWVTRGWASDVLLDGYALDFGNRGDAGENFSDPVIAQRVHAALVARRYRPGVRHTTKEALLRGLGLCGRCGASLGGSQIAWSAPRPVEVLCTGCGVTYPSGTKFCGRCGRTL